MKQLAGAILVLAGSVFGLRATIMHEYESWPLIPCVGLGIIGLAYMFLSTEGKREERPEPRKDTPDSTAS